MRIAIGCDHAGYRLKGVLIDRLHALGHSVTDFGTDGTASVDYPDHAHLVTGAIIAGEADLGVLICGTGIGMSMAANKRPGIRAAAVSETFSARATREHNDANVICIGERVVGPGVAVDILDAFLGASFEGGRHQRRIDKIESLG
ncbi:MAG: ribose 5-phosphate isomerase B [Alphaproteobacteria bacterium]|nr:ribose 5-phosphate isomerase B [Alphaproteobacteria bacterium]